MAGGVNAPPKCPQGNLGRLRKELELDAVSIVRGESLTNIHVIPASRRTADDAAIRALRPKSVD